MFRMRAVYFVVVAALVSVPTFAQAQQAKVPPDNSRKLSQLISTVEQRDHFQYIKDVEWDEDGYYDITYYTTDKAKVELKLDPATGKPR